MSEPLLTPQVFAILSSLIEERLGLWYATSDMSLLENKISARVFELGLGTALDYYYYLRYDDGEGKELAQLAEALVVNETFFYREMEPLGVVLSTCVEPLIARGQRPRIWSAACATGEEPATIAMWLADRGLLGSVDLIASDVSDAALAVARAGRYRPRSLRQVPVGIEPERYMERQGDTLVLDPRIVSAIQWRRLNLIDDDAVASLGEMDVVICRNLLIYFRDDVVRKVVARLTARLRPQGVLLVGVSESLMRLGTSLVCEELNGAFIYRKRDEP